MGAVADGEFLESRVQQRAELARARDRNGIVGAVENAGYRSLDSGYDFTKSWPEIIVAQAFPDLILCPGDDAERREVLGVVKVPEISGDRQLERAPLIG